MARFSFFRQPLWPHLRSQDKTHEPQMDEQDVIINHENENKGNNRNRTPSPSPEKERAQGNQGYFHHHE